VKNNDWKWASHVPLIKGVLDLYEPQSVLELGCGLHSTPLFQVKGITYKGIDNDKDWVRDIKDKLGVIIEHHDLNGIGPAAIWNDLTASQKEDITLYYQNLGNESLLINKRPKLLFVDGFTCTRQIAIDVLKSYFDIIMYHDSHPRRKGRFTYSYKHPKQQEQGFTKYHLRTHRNWTSVMVKDDKGIDPLKGSVSPYIIEFYKQWKQNVGMKIIK